MFLVIYFQFYYYVNKRSTARDWKCQPDHWLPANLEIHEIVVGAFSLAIGSFLSSILACWIINDGWSTGIANQLLFVFRFLYKGLEESNSIFVSCYAELVIRKKNSKGKYPHISNIAMEVEHTCYLTVYFDPKEYGYAWLLIQVPFIFIWQVSRTLISDASPFLLSRNAIQWIRN